MKPTRAIFRRLPLLSFIVIAFSAADVQALTYTWVPTTANTYSWDAGSSNWTSGFPNAADDIANLNINLTGNQIINLNQAITVGTINLGDTTGGTYNTTTIAAGTSGSLIMDVASGSALISKATAANNVTDTISAGIQLNDNLIVNNAATGGLLTLSGIISQNAAGKTLTKTGAGIVRLSAASSYTGLTTISQGTLELHSNTGSLNAASGLTFNGVGGTFNMDNNGASASRSQSLNALTFSAGDGIVLQTRTAAQNQLLTFVSLSARATGATGNIFSGGTLSASNGVAITGQSAGFIDRGLFYGSSATQFDSYAWYDSSGFIRAMAYGSDSGAVTSGAATTLASATHQQITGAITAQQTATFNTLKINGANNLALATGQTVTVDGILKTGNNASTISGGTNIQAASNAELVIRTNQSSDNLTIGSSIFANGTNALTKTGAGKLTLSGTNTYTGGTYLNAGTLELSNGAALGSGTLTINGGTLTVNNGAFTNNNNIVANNDFSLTGGNASNTGTGSFRISRALTISGGGGNDAGNADGINVSNLITDASGGNTLNALDIYWNIGSGSTVAFTLSAPITLNSNQSLNFTATHVTSNLNITGAIGDGGNNRGVTFLNNGAPAPGYGRGPGVFLMGSNTYTGTTTINSGAVVSLGKGGTVGSLNPGSAIVNNGTFGLYRSDTILQGIDFGTISGSGTIVKNGGGLTVLNAANSYSGVTTIQGGTLRVSSVSNAGNNSPLGAYATAGAAGISLTGGTLQYTGSTASTDRGFTLGGSATIDVTPDSGSSALTLGASSLGAFTLTVSGTGGSSLNLGALTLTGNATLSPGTANLTVASLAGGSNTLTKSGAGRLWVTGNNTSTGLTTVSAGRLGGSGTFSGALTLSGTGGIDLRNGAVNTLTVNGNLSIGGAAGANPLFFDLGSGAAGADKIVVGGTTSMTTSGAGVITINQLGGLASPSTAGTYTLIQGTGAVPTASSFSLATTKAFGQIYTLGVSGNNLQLTTANGTAGPAGPAWSGGTNASWSNTGNWVGTATPGYESNVSMYNTGAGNLSTALNGDFDINSLNYGAGSTTATTIAQGTVGMLTIEATTANGNTAGSGITVATPTSGTPTHTISARVGIASSQTWTVNSGAALTVSGVVSDFGGGYSLTKTDAGTLTLSGANTFGGGVTLSGGKLVLGNNEALGLGALTIGNGTTLDVSSALTATNNNIQNWNGDFTFGGANTLNLGTGAVTMNASSQITVSASTLTVGGAISGSGYGLTKAGAGTLVVSGFSSYTGATTINAGTLSINSIQNENGGISAIGNPTVGNGTIAIGSTTTAGQLTYTGSGNTTDRAINMAGTTGGATLDQSGTGALKFTSAFTASGSGAKTLTLQGATAGTGEIAGAIVDSGGGATALTKSGSGTWILSGANTYTGTTTLSGGTLRLNHATALKGGIGASGGLTALTINGGMLELTAASGDFLRDLGTGVAQARITGGTSGFSALGGARTVNFNNNSQEIQWGSATFNPTTLVLNSANADSKLTLANAIDLNAATRTVQVNANVAEISSVIRTASGTAGLTKNGNGTLILTGSNSYNGVTTISAGTLSIGSAPTASANGPLGNYAAGAAGISLSGGTLQYTGATASTTRGFTLAASSTIDVRPASGNSTLTLGASSLGAFTLNVTGATNGNLGLGAVTLTGAATLNPTSANLTVASVATSSNSNLTLGGTSTGNSVTGSLNLGTGTLTKNGTSVWTLNGATSSGGLAVGNETAGGTLVLTGGTSLSVGSGTGTLGIGLGNNTSSGTLDASRAATVAINVANVAIGSLTGGGSNNVGTLNLGASNQITASTVFYIGSAASIAGSGNGTNGNNIGTLTTANNSTTTIKTPTLGVGFSGGGWGSSTGSVTIGTGATFNVEGTSGGRSSMRVGQHSSSNGGTFAGTVDLSGGGTGVANLKLSTLEIAKTTGRDVSGSMTMSSSSSNVLDVSGAGNVVQIGWSNQSSGTATGTLTIGGLNSNSLIESTDNSTAILIAYKGSSSAATGTLNLNGGTVSIKTTGAAIAGGTGNSTLNLDGGVILKAAAASTNWITSLTTAEIKAGGATINTNTYDIGISQGFSGAGGLTKDGAGTLTLNGSNTYAGTTTVSAGTLTLGAADRISNSSALSVTGGTFNLGGFSETVAAVSMSSGTMSNGTLTGSSYSFTNSGNVSANLAGSSVALTKSGAGVLTLSGSNTFSGQLSVQAGTLAIGTINDASSNGVLGNSANSVSLGNTGSVTGTLQYTGASVSSTKKFTMATGGTGAFQVDNSNTTLSLGGVIDGSGNLAKTGAGTLTLTAGTTHQYTGTTYVTEGTLVVNGNISTSSLTTIGDGVNAATFGGSGTVGDLTISANAFHNPGNSPGIVNTGDYTMAGTLNIEVNGPTPGITGHDQVNVTGTVNLSGSLNVIFGGGIYANGDMIFILLNDSNDAINGTFSALAQGATVTSYGGYDWIISYTADSNGTPSPTFTGGNDVVLMAVPEPAAAILGSIGMVLLLRRRRVA